MSGLQIKHSLILFLLILFQWQRQLMLWVVCSIVRLLLVTAGPSYLPDG
jgi:hypothetical protein